MDEDDDLIPQELQSLPDETPTDFFESPYLALIPPPHVLEAYEKIVPGAAARILDRIERESDHRHWMERAKRDADIRAQARGQWFGFIIAMLGMGGCFGLIWIGQSWFGLAVLLATLTALASVFFYGKRKQESFLDKQLKEFRELASELRKPLPEPEE